MDKLAGAVRSKTMWLVSFAPMVLGLIDMLTQNSVVTTALQALGFGPVLMFLGALAGLLRWITSKPLEDKAP